MACPYAFVTLLTSDHYLPGALTLVAALRDIHPSPAISPEVDFQTVCLVTPETVDVSTIKLLRKTFDVVVGVELIAQKDEKGLALLGKLPKFQLYTRHRRFGHILCPLRGLERVGTHDLCQWGHSNTLQAAPSVMRTNLLSFFRSSGSQRGPHKVTRISFNTVLQDYIP